MGFKPKEKKSAPKGARIDYAKLNEQLLSQIEEGNNVGVVAGFVDLGLQERDPMKQDDGTYKQLKPIRQVAGFIDFPNVIIDWDKCMTWPAGMEPVKIGKAPYRHHLHHEFKGEVTGITFSPVPPMDKNGKIIEVDGNWTFHSNSVLTKLAKASKKLAVIDGTNSDNMDIELLIGQAVLVNVEIKQGKYVALRGYSPLMTGMSVDTSQIDTFLVDFDTTDREVLGKLRYGIKKAMSRAPEFVGSPVAAIFKETDNIEPDVPLDDADNSPEPEEENQSPEPKGSAAGTGGFEDIDDSIPF
jgi:hypothetical protein